MSDGGEKTCPLCTEEMDLTDQQLKACKCGYEICVWCWHHIMDMAEKDDTEGRCPACRTAYDKEKIVGMASRCERLVSEINSERKMKAHKAKPKSSDGRKHLSSVRVIQRNLVYIIGLPLNLADEDLLQRKEYFGQYGKVLKISISRTAGGAIQHSAYNTCSIYITYSKEEEAVRCIQSVHGFVLEGRSLRACFGTTKYCHAWLRNMPCNNPDCLYLHDIGTQEDSFTKDEIISAFTRSRVQQSTGATNNLQWRSGNMLPPPIDDYCSNSTASMAKPIIKNGANQNTASQIRGSPPDGSSGRSISLPVAASWGMRVSNILQPASSSACSNGPAKQKPDTWSCSLVQPTTVASTSQSSTPLADIGNTYMISEESPACQPNGQLGRLEPTKQYAVRDSRTTVSDISALSVPVAASCIPASNDKDRGTLPTNTINSVEISGQSSGSGPDKDGNFIEDGRVQSLCSGLLSMNIEGHPGNEQVEDIIPNSLVSNFVGSSGNQGLRKYSGEQYREHCSPEYREHLSLPTPRKAALVASNGICAIRKQSEWRSDSHLQVLGEARGEVEDAVLAFDNQKLNNIEDVSYSSYLPGASHPPKQPNHSSSHFSRQNEANSASNINADPGIVHKTFDEASRLYTSCNSVSFNGYNENSNSAGLDGVFERSNLFSNAEKGKYIGRFDDNMTNVEKNPALDMGESSIISNILSMDIDAWDDTLTSPRKLARLLGETDKQHGSLKLSSSWKGQNSNQSRFSFARQEEFPNQANDMEPLDMPKECPYPQDSLENRAYLEKSRNGFSSISFEESDTSFSSHPMMSPSSHPIMSSSKLPVSRAQISVPPGFLSPSRAPPPGFSFHERMDQALEATSGHRLFEASSLQRNQYQVSATGHFGSIGDVELIDPAILAVGKGRLPNGVNNSGLDLRLTLPPQLSASENEAARLQLLMQQSISAHQNLKFSDHIGDRFSPLNDVYGIPSRIMDHQSHASNNLSPFSQLSFQQSRNARLSNGHWDGWNEAQSGGSDLGMGELLRNERMGLNKYFQGYEDLRFRMPSSSNVYNRAFGM